MLKVQSIFASIDGEVNAYDGAGQVSTFIRLHSCNLRCTYCDTKYAQGQCETLGQTWKKMEIHEIIDQMINQKVTLTGGEPLFQGGEVASLIALLISKGHDVTVETNGSIPLMRYGLCYYPRDREGHRGSVRFVMDYKLPSSGMEDKMCLDNFHLLKPQDVIKFVVSDTADWFRVRDVVHTYCLTCLARIVVSPAVSIVDGHTNLTWAVTLANLLVKEPMWAGHSGPEAQYSLQLHKILWPTSGEKDER